MCSESPSRHAGRWREKRMSLAAVSRLYRPALLLAVACCLAGCHSGTKTRRRPAKLVVMVSILPQAYFAERLAGDLADVEVLVGPGQSPHTFEPTPRQLDQLAKADVYFLAGVPFEYTLCRKIAEQVSGLRMVDTLRGITLMGAGDDRPGPHADEQIDPHVWLSPPLAKIQARNMADALCGIDPADAETYRSNLARLSADLDALDAKLAKALAPLKGRTFFVFHPAFGYFARRYGLTQRAVEIGGKSPGPRHIRQLVDQARAEAVKVIFVQPQFSQAAAKAIAEQIGGAVVLIDPLARDYMANLLETADKLHAALGRPGRSGRQRVGPAAGGGN